jgi:myo-inositol-hexaphosphate 3-phosphohydrolase
MEYTIERIKEILEQPKVDPDIQFVEEKEDGTKVYSAVQTYPFVVTLYHAIELTPIYAIVDKDENGKIFKTEVKFDR